ncbi:MAG: hypothetical protein L6U61_04090 [Bacteroidales bacterium]|nr:MAG: hypothetical protein L6U61_08030 [Bacteroidales bacterium]UKI25745.1 MAG: hypothetical protein L6U61_04090 [Bacteroidales bacterium]
MSNDCFIICAEHTGQYTYPLICACKSVGSKLWLEKRLADKNTVPA